MVLGTAIPAAFAANAQPNDVSGNKYQTAIDTLTTMGTLPLYSDGSFRPDLTVSRGQAIAYLFNVASKIGTDTNNPMPVYTLKQQPFMDENSYFRNEINNMYLAGYLNNVDLGNGAIGQNYKTPTWWFAQVLCNIAGVSYDSGKTYDALNQARAQGWFDNTDDKTGNPNYYLSRGEMAQVMETFFMAQDKAAFTGVVTSVTATASSTAGSGQADPIVVTAKDATGNTVDLSTGNHTVTYAVTSSNAADAAITSGGSFVGTMAGAYTVVASVDGIQSAPVTINVYGQVSGLTITPASATVVANGVSTDVVTLTAVDANGNAVGNYSGQATVTDNGRWLVVSTSSSGVNSLGNSFITTFTNGVATVTLQAPTAPGLTDTLTTSAMTSLPTGVTVTYPTTTVSSTNQVATSVKLTANNATLQANTGGNLASFSVEVDDQSGQAMLGGYYPVAVTLAGPATFNDGTTGSQTAVFNGNNTPGSPSDATVYVKSVSGEAGTVTLTGTANGLTSGSATLAAVIAGPAAKLALSDSTPSFAQGSNTTVSVSQVDANGNPASTSEAANYTVTVTDSAGQPATGVTVNGVAVSSTGTAAISGNSFVVSTILTSAEAGTYNVSIADANSSGTLAASTPLQLTVTPGTTEKYEFTTTALQVSEQNPTTTLTLQTVDQYGNKLTLNGATFTVNAAGGTGSATLNGVTVSTTPVTVTTNASGVATVNFAAQPYVGSTWTISVASAVDASNQTISGVSGAASATVGIAGTVATTVSGSLLNTGTSLYSTSTTSAKAGDTVSLTVYAKDQYGNPVNNDTIVLTPSAGLTFPTVVGLTDNGDGTYTAHTSSGVYSVAGIIAKGAGTQTINIQDTSAPTTPSSTSALSVVAGAQTGFGVFYNGTNLALNNTNDTVSFASATPTAVVVEPVDAYGNPVASSSSSSTDATLAPTANSEWRLTANGQDVTSVTLPAGATGVTVFYINDATTSLYSNLLASPTAVTGISVSPATVSIADGSSQVVTATVYDASGNPVIGPNTVTFTVGATTTNVTTYNGVATLTYSAPTSGTGSVTVTATSGTFSGTSVISFN